jgi:hypothetical protein
LEDPLCKEEYYIIEELIVHLDFNFTTNQSIKQQEETVIVIIKTKGKIENPTSIDCRFPSILLCTTTLQSKRMILSGRQPFRQRTVCKPSLLDIAIGRGGGGGHGFNNITPSKDIPNNNKRKLNEWLGLRNDIIDKHFFELVTKKGAREKKIYKHTLFRSTRIV